MTVTLGVNMKPRAKLQARPDPHDHRGLIYIVIISIHRGSFGKTSKVAWYALSDLFSWGRKNDVWHHLGSCQNWPCIVLLLR